MSVDGTPLLDHGVVADLRASTGDDDDFIRELVETYVVEGAANLEDMAAAAAAGDPAAIVRPAHTLKSSSASLGAMRLSAIARAIEEGGRAGQLQGAGGEDVDLARATWVETLAAFATAGLRG